MKSHWKIDFGSLCEIGDRKPTNQDNVFVAADMIDNKRVGLFVVADGVGGLKCGEDISMLIVGYFKRWFEMLKERNSVPENVLAEINSCVVTINKAAYDFAVSKGEKMGSTIALLMTVEDKYYLCNVGDSRVYRICGGELFQLSYDHSYTAELVRRGELSPQDAENHPKRNVITMCIGTNTNINPFYASGDCSKQDMFLVCSDGFYNFSDKTQAGALFADKKLHPSDKVQYLRQTIPQGNARDNVSIILVEMKKTLFAHE